VAKSHKYEEFTTVQVKNMPILRSWMDAVA